MAEVTTSDHCLVLRPLVVTDTAPKVLAKGKAEVMAPAVVLGCGLDETLAEFEVMTVWSKGVCVCLSRPSCPSSTIVRLG